MWSQYKEMWERLNLDIPAHDALLEVLGKFYGDIYLSQQGRLKGMEYLDFVISEIHGLRIKELQEAKAKGRKVVGTFCIFVPEEIVWAADAICVGLCAGAEAGYDKVEEILPRNTCALIKSFVGFKLSKLCPFFESCDLVIGETTCDGKKKAYEIFGEYVPMYVMEVPQMKWDADRELWRSEILRLKAKIEELTGREIDYQNLLSAIKMINNRRKALWRLNELRKAVPVPISGRDALLINQISFYDDPTRFTSKVNELCDELEARIRQKEGVVPNGTVRLMLSGCPMAIPNWKLPYVIESSGAVVVFEESCVGSRNTRDLVEEDKKDLDGLIDALVDRYSKIDCACFTPNEERLEHIVAHAKDYGVDGVIYYH
ncbi:MAG: double-cubane-cluster-containing anaerobic reductase, partial [Desulfatiglandales bacterium]